MSRDRLRRLHEVLLRTLMSFMVVRDDGRARRTEDGAAIVEYALILGMVVVAGLGALLLIGGHVSQDIGNTAQGFGP